MVWLCRGNNSQGTDVMDQEKLVIKKNKIKCDLSQNSKYLQEFLVIKYRECFTGPPEKIFLLVEYPLFFDELV